nr:enhanced entry protein EnhB [uncultured Legionella sp.]
MKPFNYSHKILLVSMILINSTHAASIFPRGCEVSGFGYDKNFLILNDTGEQSYYLMQNRSDAKIELERHETGDVFMSPPLQATIEPANWAAFASDVKNLNFKCYKHVEENTTAINCSDVLDVCQYPRVRFALSNMGNYWISANKSQHNVIQDSVAKGIYLKW